MASWCAASPAMRTLATGQLLPGIPNALLVWGAIGTATVLFTASDGFGTTLPTALAIQVVPGS